LHPRASLQGFPPFTGWRHTGRISPARTPWLSWASPSLGLSPPVALDFRGNPPPFGLGLIRPGGCRLPAFAKQSVPSLDRSSSRHFGERPFWVVYPVLQSFKEHGNRLVSSKTAGPSEVPVLVPAVAGWVSDRPRLPVTGGRFHLGESFHLSFRSRGTSIVSVALSVLL
jgi:hypothetical protein